MIEGNYFEDGRSRAPRERLDRRGWSREIRESNDDRFSHYFTAEQLEHFEAATSGRFSGVGLNVSEVQRGLRVATGVRGHARPRRPGSRRAT